MTTTIIAAVFVLGILILIHELGHFLSAKLFRIRVERFSLGYPPRLFGKKIGETDYCVSAIPFGGYVKVSGMVDESFDKETLSQDPQPWEYRSRPWIQKVLVVLAGPLMNLLFAYLVFSAAVLYYGVPKAAPGTVVGQVVQDMPAARAGMKAGDAITSVNGSPVETWNDLTSVIHHAAGDSVTVVWSRGDTLMSRVMVPRTGTVTDEEGREKEVGLIGIGPELEYEPAGPVTALAKGGETMADVTSLVVTSIVKLITREESVKNLGGPVIIAKMAGESARSGLDSLFGFMAFLSLNLGILNLLPIPVLDGGHLLFLFIEGVIRREVPVKVKLVFQQIGMLLLLALMAFVIYNDLTRVFNP